MWMAAVSFSFLQFLQCFDSADCVTARPSGSSYDQMPLLSPSRTKKTANVESWRGPNTLGAHDLHSWRGRIPRGGCGYVSGT